MNMLLTLPANTVVLFILTLVTDRFTELAKLFVQVVELLGQFFAQLIHTFLQLDDFFEGFCEHSLYARQLVSHFSIISLSGTVLTCKVHVLVVLKAAYEHKQPQ
jgi:hypothetical protein